MIGTSKSRHPSLCAKAQVSILGSRGPDGFQFIESFPVLTKVIFMLELRIIRNNVLIWRGTSCWRNFKIRWQL